MKYVALARKQERPARDVDLEGTLGRVVDRKTVQAFGSAGSIVTVAGSVTSASIAASGQAQFRSARE
ncbi:MAG: hypothetical protein ACTHJQ_11540 [Rhizobiaceae bacterium]